MADNSVLEKIALDLLKSSEDFVWPADRPDDRDRWIRAVDAEPDILGRKGRGYEQEVTSLFYCLSDVGYDMLSMKGDNIPGSLGKIRADIKRFTDTDMELRKDMAGIRAVLNLSAGHVDVHALLGIARSDFIRREGMHDARNLMSGYGFLKPDQIGEPEMERTVEIGKHLSRIGMGGANMIVYGPVSMTPLMYCLADETKSFFEKTERGKLMIEYSPESISIDSDESNLYRCFYNLSSNAMNRGKANKLRISAAQSSPNVVIEFADNGTGLPNTDKIFECGESYSSGQGLGLFITKQIIKAHGGNIAAVAHNNDPVYSGALFRITLPIKQNCPVHYPTYF